MRTSHSNTRPLIAGLCVLLMGAWAFCARAQVTVIQVGQPTFYVAGQVQLAAPIGTFDDNFAEWMVSTAKLLPPPNHQLHPQLGVGPGAPHSGYDTELSTGLAGSGFKQGTIYTVEDFKLPNAVWVGFMVVAGPGAPQGSSPDYLLGPIIPGPINVPFAATYRNGELFDSASGLSVPPLREVDPPFDVDGHSHFPYFWADAFDWAPPGVTDPKGNYEFIIQMRDTGGNGWDITADFTVVPEPATCGLLAGLGLLAFAWLRRRA